MNRSHYQSLCLMLILCISLLGCTMTLVKPETNFTPKEQLDPARVAQLKFSYHVFYAWNAGAKKALADSFSALGVKDAIPSDTILPNHAHVIVYQQSSKTQPQYLLVPWTLISMSTLAIIPVYAERTQQFEIQVIDPDQPFDKQITTTPSEIITSGFMWLPLAFMLNSETNENKEYTNIFSFFSFSPPKQDLAYLGYRRIFDEVLWNAINNKIKSTD